MKKVSVQAEELGIEKYIPYGDYTAKIPVDTVYSKERKGKVVLVTSMNPTPYGEGKTTTAIGLTQALWNSEIKSMVAIREPSLGPVFGVKGGGTGGGEASVHPAEDINLHFTGDFHAIQTAHNLLAAILDNHMKWGNALRINTKKIFWKRVLDINDRALRQVITGLGEVNGLAVESGFEITPASEIMAILAGSRSCDELEEKLGKILLALDADKNPVFSGQLNVTGSLMALLKYALMPNLVQTTQGRPAVIHTGPFANIALGTNSILADELAMRHSDVLVTEAGFGADLGAEKFVNVFSRMFNVPVNASVVVTTVRAIKYHGEGAVNPIKEGFGNLRHHIGIMKKFGIPHVVLINLMGDEKDREIDAVRKLLDKEDVPHVMASPYRMSNMNELAEEVMRNTGNGRAEYTYDLEDDLKTKIKKVACDVYGASEVVFTSRAERMLKLAEKTGMENAPVCMAKTQLSLTDNPHIRGAPGRFRVRVKDVKISSGAGFVVPILGDMMTMPGLPRGPRAESIRLVDGEIKGIMG